MSIHILEGGTDVAEMAFFCSDSIPEKQPDYEIIEELVKNNKLVVLPTGSDGGYLLHLYVGEEIDNKTMEFCSQEDTINSLINIQKGNISFGGVESAFSGFKENKNIRSDSKVEKGLYNITFYQTEYPEELFEEKIRHDVGLKNMKHNSIPSYVIGISFFLSIVLIVLTINSSIKFGLALIVFVLAIYFWYKKYTGSDKYLAIEKKISEVNNSFPSIVGVMKKP